MAIGFAAVENEISEVEKKTLGGETSEERLRKK